MAAASVTVLIPSYNHCRFLPATLESVFRQTVLPEELYVIDDGSTDDSVEVIKREFARYRGPIRCRLEVRGNRGISATRNELAATVTTRYASFLDSDDRYAVNRIERMTRAASAEGPFLAFSGVDFLSERDDDTLAEWNDLYDTFLAQGAAFPTAGFALLRFNVAISASNLFLTRCLLRSIAGFDDRIRICQDWDFIAQMLPLVEPTFIPEPLLTYRLHATNTSLESAGHTHEIDIVRDKVATWILKPAANPAAPTPANWPRYFRIFAQTQSVSAGLVVAAQLPRAALVPGPSTDSESRDGHAIRMLLAAARSTDSGAGLPRYELFLRCQRVWNRARSTPSDGFRDRCQP